MKEADIYTYLVESNGMCELCNKESQFYYYLGHSHIHNLAVYVCQDHLGYAHAKESIGVPLACI